VARSDPALQAPDESKYDFDKFPCKTLRAGSVWFRQHNKRSGPDHGAWYFTPRIAGTDSKGRFDLPEPDGTCYLASSELGAVNELVGPDHTRRGWVDADLVDGRVLSRLVLPDDVKSADTTSPRASTFRLSTELATIDDYDLTQAWADTVHRHGFGGVYVTLRFTPGRARALALFGPEGAPSSLPPGDPSPVSVRGFVQEWGTEVVDRPVLAAVRVVLPT
jgi:hypothetical protein